LAIFGKISRKSVALIGHIRASVRDSRLGSYGLLVAVFAIAYGCIFSYFTILRHDTYYSAAWDLGIFNQAFHTTLFEGRLFYYTPDLFFNPSGSLFAIHTSPILFLLLPFYAINPSPAALLVIKSFAVGLAAIPLYLLARQLLKDGKLGFLLAITYLLYPPLQGANWFDFQQAALIPLFLFLMYYFLIKKDWKLYFPMVVLTLMIQEYLAIIVAILALYHYSYSHGLRSLPKSLRQLKTAENLATISTMVVCVIYLSSALSIKSTFPISAGFSNVYKVTGNFEVLGSSDTLTFPVYILLHPQRAIEALIYDYPLKFFYVVALLAPLLFIPLRNRFFLGFLLLMAPFLLSNYMPYYSFGVHYPFYILPVLFIATIYGLSRLELKARSSTIKGIIVVTLIFVVSMGPLSPLSSTFIKTNNFYYSPIEFSLSESDRSLNDLISAIPANASVLTQNFIFPHVSDKANAYTTPFSDYGNPKEMGEYLNYLLNNSEYVLLDLRSLGDMDKIVLKQITSNNSYALYGLSSQAVLFKRGYTGGLLFAHYADERIYQVYRDLIVLSPPGSTVVDPSANGEKVFFYPKGSVGCCIFGPYTYLIQGSYEATFTVKVGEHSAAYLGTFDVTTDVGMHILSAKNVNGSELRPEEWINITVPFSVATFSTGMEFRVTSGGTADIYVDRVIVKRVSAVP
jgi:uncharacterized membrane protein